MKMHCLRWLIFITSGLIMISCRPADNIPTANKGTLDLSKWSFAKNGNVRLDGQWVFYWEQFLKASDFDTVANKQFMRVAGSWKNNEWNGKKLDGHGYATYYLKLLLPDKKGNIALKIPDQGTAFEFRINDSLICKNGKIGKTKESSNPQYLPQIITYNYISDTLNLIFNISNFHFWMGGLEFPISAGSEKEIRSKREINSLIEILLTGILLLSFFAFFNIAVFRRKEKMYIFFALNCLLLAIRTITTGEKIILIPFPNINFELLIKLEGLSWMICAIVTSLYFYDLFKAQFNRKIFYFLNSLFVVYSFITLLFTAEINSETLMIAEVSMLILGGYMIYVCSKALKLKREGSLILLLGFSIQMIFNLTDVLYYNYIIPALLPVSLVPIGTFIWSNSQITLLSRKFAKAYKRLESYAADLRKEVESKTHDLREEKEKSEKLLLNVLPEQIAARLKRGETPIADHYEEASVIFIDIVGFTKLSSRANPQDMVRMLNDIFSIFDKISAKYGLEKIKTIGDCYMAAAGIPIRRDDHANVVAQMAIEAIDAMEGYSYNHHAIDTKLKNIEGELKFRVGLDCGPIVAGVIGEQKFIYDLWGDMVNTASRMESNGVIGRIQCTDRFQRKIGSKAQKLGIRFRERGEIEIKGKGMMKTFFLEKS